MPDPVWVTKARSLIGTKEIVGTQNSMYIMGWAKTLGAKILGAAYNDDETPWCGLFMAYVFKQCGIEPPSIALRAASWDKFGIPTSPRVGAVLRFQRPGGGHVGLYLSEDENTYRVLGGNQNNMVSDVAKIAKDRLVACRWPIGWPITTVPVNTSFAAAASTNER